MTYMLSCPPVSHMWSNFGNVIISSTPTLSTSIVQLFLDSQFLMKFVVVFGSFLRLLFSIRFFSFHQMAKFLPGQFSNQFERFGHFSKLIDHKNFAPVIQTPKSSTPMFQNNVPLLCKETKKKRWYCTGQQHPEGTGWYTTTWNDKTEVYLVINL